MMARRLIIINGWSARASLWSSLIDGWKEFDCHVIDLDDSESISMMLDGNSPLLEVPFVLAGWSLGGKYAIEIASKQHHNLKALVTLQMPLSFTSDPSIDSNNEERSLTEAFGQLGQRIREGEIESALKAFCFQICRSKQEYRAYMEIMKVESPHSQTCLLEGLRSLSLPIDGQCHWANISVPQLHLFGKRDPLVPESTVSQFKWPKDADLVFLEDVGHIPFFSSAAQVKKGISDFIKAEVCL